MPLGAVWKILGMLLHQFPQCLQIELWVLEGCFLYTIQVILLVRWGRVEEMLDRQYPFGLMDCNLDNQEIEAHFDER